jgi:hypothetical protein
VSVAPLSFDFGSVLPDKPLQRDFVIRNVGAAVLTIKDITTTCSCTVVGNYAKTLAPGASTSLRVELTTPAVPGPIEQGVAIESNDPAQPRVEVKVQATVVASAKRD